MDDLTTRLLAAIGETERLANRAALVVQEALRVGPEAAPHWRYDDVNGAVVLAPSRELFAPPRGEPVATAPAGGYLNDMGEHIALHDPAAVLRRCAADRGIVAQHKPAPSYDDDPPYCGVCVEPGYIGIEYCCDWPRVQWPCPTLRYVAEGYGITDAQEAS